MVSVSEAPSGARDISGPFIASPSFQKQSLSQLIARKLHSWTINPFPLRPTSSTSDKICIFCISDTHNMKPSLPDGDILLHAGDVSEYGLFNEIQAQIDWLNTQPHRHKIIIAGNHDLTLDEAFVKAHPDRELDKLGKSRSDLKWGHVKYLHNSSIEVDCNGRILKIYGSPMTPKCGNFCFQHDPDKDVWANTVPDGTDILLTHGPPAVHLDEGKGCRHLIKEIWRARPKLVVFGHIHDGRGEEIITFDRVQASYENVLLGVRPWINVFKLMLYTLSQMLGRSSVTGSSTLSTHMVNAAMVAGRGNQDRREPIIAYV